MTVVVAVVVVAAVVAVVVAVVVVCVAIEEDRPWREHRRRRDAGRVL